MKTFIGIDNGVSGSIGIIDIDSLTVFAQTKTFTKNEQDYTKKKKRITRIDNPMLQRWMEEWNPVNETFALVERPMVNPQYFNTTVCAMRCLESQLNILEQLDIGYAFIDSKEWQKELLPQGIKGPAALKQASKEIGIRMFPFHRDAIERQKDADGLLIAEYCRRKYGG